MSELKHYGVSALDGAPGRGSGRYELGSGEDPTPLTPAQIKKLQRADTKWLRKNDKKLRRYAEKQTRSEMKEYEKELRDVARKYKSGKNSQRYITAYNRKLAELMTKSVSDLSTPSGRMVVFVAERGNAKLKDVAIGWADRNYNMKQLNQGVFASGKVAYRNSQVDMDYGDDRKRR